MCVFVCVCVYVCHGDVYVYVRRFFRGRNCFCSSQKKLYVTC